MSAPGYRSVSTASTVTILFAVLFLQSNLAVAGEVSQSSNQPDLSVLVKSITDAQLENRERAKAYSVTREYKLFGNDALQPRTEVVAKVNFLPPNVKSYDIDQSTGGMGEKVVRHILDHEVDAARDPNMMMVNEENYRFDYIGEEALEGNACYKLRITPKHERKDLLKATIWVDKNSYHIVRMEGDPAKSPSFWVKDVHLILEFGEVAGMWMQTETLALAHLRFGGVYKLTSQDLGYDVSQAVATNSKPTVRRRHSPTVMAASMQ